MRLYHRHQTPTSTISYSYNTTGWKDQLTGYNGQAITYDEIGNPLNYRGKALTWENGRQLAGVNSNISYTYTLDGTRLAKQVGNTKTEYTLDGNLVIRQKTGNEILNFYYDSAGKLLEIGYKANASAAETYCFVTRNSQGDIGPLGRAYKRRQPFTQAHARRAEPPPLGRTGADDVGGRTVQERRLNESGQLQLRQLGQAAWRHVCRRRECIQRV